MWTMLRKFLDFITGETAARRRHDAWAEDYRRRNPPPGTPPRIVTMEEVRRRTDAVIKNAYRRGDLPVEPDHPWAKFLNG